MAKAQVERASPDRIKVSGELGAQSVPGLLRAASGWFGTGESLTVDLTDVERTDSAGVALLLDWWRQARRHNTTIHYENAPAQMLAIVNFCALEGVLPLS